MQPNEIRRSRIEILAQILGFCYCPRGKTAIMQRVNLSHTTLLISLRHLEELGLIEEGAKSKYTATQKGLVFLGKWMELLRFLSPEEHVFFTKTEGSVQRRRITYPTALKAVGTISN